MIIQKDEQIHAQSTIELVKMAYDQYPEKQTIYCFCDHARYSHGKLVQEFLQSQTKVQLLLLLPYSPNLNLNRTSLEIHKEDNYTYALLRRLFPISKSHLFAN